MSSIDDEYINPGDFVEKLISLGIKDITKIEVPK